MVRIHQGASVIATVLGESWEPFLFCVLKLVLKTAQSEWSDGMPIAWKPESGGNLLIGQATSLANSLSSKDLVGLTLTAKAQAQAHS